MTGSNQLKRGAEDEDPGYEWGAQNALETGTKRMRGEGRNTRGYRIQLAKQLKEDYLNPSVILDRANQHSWPTLPEEEVEKFVEAAAETRNAAVLLFGKYQHLGILSLLAMSSSLITRRDFRQEDIQKTPGQPVTVTQLQVVNSLKTQAYRAKDRQSGIKKRFKFNEVADRDGHAELDALADWLAKQCFIPSADEILGINEIKIATSEHRLWDTILTLEGSEVEQGKKLATLHLAYNDSQQALLDYLKEKNLRIPLRKTRPDKNSEEFRRASEDTKEAWKLCVAVHKKCKQLRQLGQTLQFLLRLSSMQKVQSWLFEHHPMPFYKRFEEMKPFFADTYCEEVPADVPEGEEDVFKELMLKRAEVNVKWLANWARSYELEFRDAGKTKVQKGVLFRKVRDARTELRAAIANLDKAKEDAAELQIITIDARGIERWMDEWQPQPFFTEGLTYD